MCHSEKTGSATGQMRLSGLTKEASIQSHTEV